VRKNRLKLSLFADTHVTCSVIRSLVTHVIMKNICRFCVFVKKTVQNPQFSYESELLVSGLLRGE
jgi:glutaredoxin